MNNNMFLVFTLVLLSSCSVVGAHHSAGCASSAKKDDCKSATSADKKIQKKNAVQTQVEQPKADREARPAKVVENKKMNESKFKAKSEGSLSVQDTKLVRKQDVIAQKKIEPEKREKDSSESMDCAKKNIKAKDDGVSNVRSVAYAIAVFCTKNGVHVESIANATIPLVLQNRAHRK
jgi:hypothetical protein